MSKHLLRDGTSKVGTRRFVPLVLVSLSAVLFPSVTLAADVVGTVRKVIDGDTILLQDGRQVRYLGINAPEHGQPHAREATDFNQRLVSGRSVRLEFDKVREDRYGRLPVKPSKNVTRA